MSTLRRQLTLYIPELWHFLLAVLWSWPLLQPQRTRAECGRTPTGVEGRGGHWRLNLYLANSVGLSMAFSSTDGTPAGSCLFISDFP